MPRWLAISLATLTAAVLVAGCVEGSTEPRVYVANRAGALWAGYNSCDDKGKIQELTLDSNPASSASPKSLWHIKLASGEGAASIPLGVVPPGYREVTPYDERAVDNLKSVVVALVGVDGYSSGFAADLSDIPPGNVVWSQGIRAGSDLSGVHKSTFGC